MILLLQPLCVLKMTLFNMFGVWSKKAQVADWLACYLLGLTHHSHSSLSLSRQKERYLKFVDMCMAVQFW